MSSLDFLRIAFGLFMFCFLLGERWLVNFHVRTTFETIKLISLIEWIAWGICGIRCILQFGYFRYLAIFDMTTIQFVATILIGVLHFFKYIPILHFSLYLDVSYMVGLWEIGGQQGLQREEIIGYANDWLAIVLLGSLCIKFQLHGLSLFQVSLEVLGLRPFEVEDDEVVIGVLQNHIDATIESTDGIQGDIELYFAANRL